MGFEAGTRAVLLVPFHQAGPARRYGGPFSSPKAPATPGDAQMGCQQTP